MTALSLNVNATDKDGSKRIIVHECLSEDCSTEEDKRECTIMEHKDAENEVTYDVP